MIKHFLYILLAIITVACSKGNVNVSGSVNEGKIAEEGTPAEIFESPKCERLRTFLSKVL